MAVSKKLRFEVFKRDSFTCQYCGRSAPDVVLQCDHIEPVSKGGSDDILNLITSCFDCNSGKRARTLDDDTVLVKRKAQLDDLQERREQIEMMLRWQEGLTEADELRAEAVKDIWEGLMPTIRLNDRGKARCLKYVRKHEFSLLCDAMRRAATEYTVIDDDGYPTSDSAERAWHMVEKIASLMEKELSGEIPPYLKDCLYIRGIVRNRLLRTAPKTTLYRKACPQEREALQLLTECAGCGCSIEAMMNWAKQARTWTEWKQVMEATLKEAATGGGADYAEAMV